MSLAKDFKVQDCSSECGTRHSLNFSPLCAQSTLPRWMQTLYITFSSASSMTTVQIVSYQMTWENRLEYPRLRDLTIPHWIPRLVRSRPSQTLRIRFHSMNRLYGKFSSCQLNSYVLDFCPVLYPEIHIFHVYEYPRRIQATVVTATTSAADPDPDPDPAPFVEPDPDPAPSSLAEIEYPNRSESVLPVSSS